MIVKENPSSLDSAGEGPSGSSGPAFRKLFATGVMGWLVGMVALFGASWIFTKPETAAVAMLWVISHWWIAYLFGLVVMVIRGLMSRRSLGRAIGAYVLPVGLLLGVAWLCLALYPDAGLRGDLFTFLPVVLVFYGFGSLWMSGGREAGDSSAFLRAVVPSLMGGLMILGFVAVPAFASDSFRYRDTFDLKITKTTVKDGTMISEGSLGIRKSGDYQFSAPRYVWEMTSSTQSTEPEVELGEIQWGAAGAPKAGTQGEFPLRIVWRKGVIAGDAAQIPPYEDLIVIEVRRPDEDGRLVYSVTAPMGIQ